MTKMHWARLNGDGVTFDFALCGQDPANRTNDRDAVTCLRCIRYIDRLEREGITFPTSMERF